MGNTEKLRDRQGRLLGEIIQKSDGKFEGRDKFGRLMGTYEPKSNQTRDARGSVVGTGNLLASLITAA